MGSDGQGFPDDFIIPVANACVYQQFGNSVAVPAIRAIANQIIKTLSKKMLTGNKGE